MPEPLDDYFTATIGAMSAAPSVPEPGEPIRADTSLTVKDCLTLFDAQLEKPFPKCNSWRR